MNLPPWSPVISGATSLGSMDYKGALLYQMEPIETLCYSNLSTYNNIVDKVFIMSRAD